MSEFSVPENLKNWIPVTHEQYQEKEKWLMRGEITKLQNRVRELEQKLALVEPLLEKYLREKERRGE